MVESDNLEESGIKQKQKHNNYFQVDVLKTIMIFLVIFDHTIPWSIKGDLGVALWERISIPMFMVIMGFNIGKSLQAKKDPIKDSFYTREFFFNKFYRYVIPFAILYFISTIIGGLIYGFSIDSIQAGQWGTNYNDLHLLIGILPFWGPGNWFIPIIFGSIIILPGLYKGFSGPRYKAIYTLIVTFIVELIVQSIIFFTFKNPNPPPTFATWEDYYYALFFIYSIFLLLSAVGFGMWFSRDHNLFSKNNFFVWILFFISLSYLIAYQFFDYRILVNGIPFLTGDYNFMVFPYSAFLFLVALKTLPSDSKNKLARVIKKISKSTYHILLVQILYFAIVYALYGDHYSASIFGIDQGSILMTYLYLIINWSICIPIGVFWWQKEKQVIHYFKSKIQIESEPSFRIN
ncbi:MAG: acyltransferase [Promethearchaeota archaeon]|nr:MAG: acyltransferase [Candidatus Lokiarchaeota archaeon]